MEKQIKDYLHLYLGCEINTSIKGTTMNCYWLNRIRNNECDGLPILRPLSDMTISEKSKFNPKIEDGEIGQCFIGSESETSYAFVSFVDMARTINELRALGFDCDGLIESGLAIDATTLKK